MAIAFPQIDPIIFTIGPLSVRWYSLAYIAGILLGIHYIRALDKTKPNIFGDKTLDDLLVWTIISIIFGGRIGYVLFYHPEWVFNAPLEVIKTWNGGMSFHGGFVGFIIALILFCRKYKLDFWRVSDLVACAAPIGIFLGRIANFLNAELYGRITDCAWGVVFPYAGSLPRHPSQLYEAISEGMLNFLLLTLIARYTKARQYPGLLSGCFLFAYSSSRIICEFYRQPDIHIGFIFKDITMGQILSLPMLLAAIYIIFHSYKLNVKNRI